MRFQAAVWLAAAVPFLTTLAPPTSAQSPADATAPATRISGPFTHDNLAVYLVHGPSAPGPVPLTLGEAMARGHAVVHETGNVNRLAIENTGSEEVFVQAGDIVKGGQQDRVLTISLLVPPRSGRIDIDAFCVEQGRWSARGKEDVKRFASAEMALPSREAKLAMMMPAKPSAAASPPMAVGSPSTAVGPLPDTSALQARTRTMPARTLNGDYGDASSRQTQMWSSVATTQRKLSDNVGSPVAAAQSASSLQLSLENTQLQSARKSFMTSLESAGTREADVVGYVFAVGGKLNSGDVYASNGLFAKMWKKQLEAAVTEAIAEKSSGSVTAPPATAPTVGDVAAFIARAEGGKSAETLQPANLVVRETRDAGSALLTETRKSAGGVLHRSYLAY